MRTSMAIAKRDRRALQAGGAALALWVLLRFAILPAWDQLQQARAELPARENALIKYRQAIAQMDTAKKSAEGLEARLRESQAGLLESSSAALASAEIQEWIKQVSSNHGIELRSSDFLALRPQANGYAELPIGVQFECRLDQFVDFLAELRSGPKIVAIPRLHVQSRDGPAKLLSVSMTLAGVMHSEGKQAGPKR